MRGQPGFPLGCISEGANLHAVPVLECRAAHGLDLMLNVAEGDVMITEDQQGSRYAPGDVGVDYRAARAAVVLEVIKRLPISDNRAPTSFPLIP